MDKEMTRDEILNMPAGREMDVLIAEDIMGLKLWYGDPTGFNITENITYWQTEYVDNDGEYCVTCPRYSTNISAAWEVMERLKIITKVAGTNTIRIYPTLGIGVNIMGLNEPEEWIVADTASLAICRAALLTVLEIK